MVRRLLPLLLIGLFSAHAHAGLFDDEEARARINKMRDDFNIRITKLEDANNRAQLDFANQIEQLKTEIARLRGENEVLTNDLANANKRQKDFYVDLDNRLRKLETTPGTAADGAQPAQPQQPAATVDPANETRDYEAALNLLRGGKYKDAAAGFNAFIKNYPNSSFQPNAHFWAASAQYQAKDNAGAAEHYAKVANQWPDDTRAPDALLGLANAQHALNDTKGATKSLERLLAKYPNSSAAQIARQRLKK
ncbi:MAG: tol-pal system protein YbgF [Proteobacteria bacterium]|nr:tol-pal system protein YbgF [Pseudomonadota bacterium]